ncbi:MAG: SDR family NAD(P)-dependent oxidoreductase [Salibacteraceae bacterium]
MSTYWKHKTVWITGASSGIGEALSQQLAARGAHLILSSRSEEKLNQVCSTLPNSNMHKVLALDVSNQEDLERVLSDSKKITKTVDVLINNAGISQRALTWEANQQSERLIMETNFFGSIRLAKEVLPNMILRNFGLIINISSVVGKFGFPLRSSYAASKHALHGYFDTLRAEAQAEKKNINVLMVCPGRIATNISLSAVVADGSKQNEMDPGLSNGLTPEYCAKRIIKAAEKGKSEIYIGKEQLLIYLKRYFPGIFRKLVSKFKPK